MDSKPYQERILEDIKKGVPAERLFYGVEKQAFVEPNPREDSRIGKEEICETKQKMRHLIAYF